MTLNGCDFYLGKWKSRQSEDEYNRLIAEWVARGRQPAPNPGSAGLLVNDVILAYWEHAEAYYRHPDRADK